MTRASASTAASLARSKSVAAMALTAGLIASIRAMQASINSTGDNCRAPMSARIRTALRPSIPPSPAPSATRASLLNRHVGTLHDRPHCLQLAFDLGVIGAGRLETDDETG